MNWAVHPSSFILHPFATVASSSEGLADYSGGPATELHRFPYSPRRARGTCRYSEEEYSGQESELPVASGGKLVPEVPFFSEILFGEARSCTIRANTRTKLRESHAQETDDHAG